jgi:zinc transport system substrate-binding protein
MKRRSFIQWAGLAAFWASGMAVAACGEPAKPLRGVVSVAPLKSIVEAALPPGSTVEMLIPPGASEHGYEIPPTRLAELVRADVVVTVGLGLDPQVAKYLRDHPKTGRIEVEFAKVAGEVAAGQADRDAATPTHDHEDHDARADHADHADHGDEEHEHHHAVDPHLWLDASCVKRLAQAVRAEVLKTHAGTDAAAFDAFMSKVDAIDAKYRQTLASAKTRAVVVAHDAWGRLADRYQITTIAISGLNAGEPTPRAVEAAAGAAKSHGVLAVAIEPQVSPRVARRIASGSGLRIVTLDPLGSGDWFEMMERNLRALAEALGVPESRP